MGSEVEMEYDYSNKDTEDRSGVVLDPMENKYYNSKGMIETNPEEALKGFAEVVSMETGKGCWGFKALKQTVKLCNKLGMDKELMVAYSKLLTYITSDVSRNDSEKSINNIMDLVSRSASRNFSLVQEFYQATLMALEEAPNERLWFKTNVKLCKILFDMGDDSRMKKILEELHKSCQNDDGTHNPNKEAQLLEVYALEIELTNQKLKQLYKNAMSIKSAICHPRIMGIIRECGGKMHMEEKQWANAAADFFDAFKNYDEAGDHRRIRCLKYLLLANMLMESEVDPFDGQEAKAYKNDPEILALTNLIAAYQRNEILEFKEFLESYRMTTMDDPFILNFIEDLLKKGCMKEIANATDVRFSQTKDAQPFNFDGHTMKNTRSGRVGSAFSSGDEDDDSDESIDDDDDSVEGSIDDEDDSAQDDNVDSDEVDDTVFSGSKVAKGPTESSKSFRSSCDNLKQTTLDASMGLRRSHRLAAVRATEDIRLAETDGKISSEDEEPPQAKRRKRAPSRGRGRDSATRAKRGAKRGRVDDDDDYRTKKPYKSQPRVLKALLDESNIFQVSPKPPHEVVAICRMLLKILRNPKRFKTLQKFLPRLSNQEYSATLHRIVMIKKEVRVYTTWCDRMVFTLKRVISLCKSNGDQTLKGFFYDGRSKKVFKKQSQASKIIHDAACLIGTNRPSLRIRASRKGLVSGKLEYTIPGKIPIRCWKHSGGKLVPNDLQLETIKDIKSTGNFILIIEKEGIFEYLTKKKFFNVYPCILICTKGQASVSTRRFLAIIASTTKLPRRALMDCDVFGFMIALTLEIGSPAMSYDSISLTTSDIHWTGLLPSDLERLKITRKHSEEENSKLPKKQKKMIRKLIKLLNELYDKKGWALELESLLINDFSASIDCMPRSRLMNEYLVDKFKDFPKGNNGSKRKRKRKRNVSRDPLSEVQMHCGLVNDSNICYSNSIIQMSSPTRTADAISPLQFVTRLRKENPIFRGQQHQDAHELFTYLLGALVDEATPSNLDMILTWRNHFQVITSIETRCMTCKDKKEPTTEYHLCLSLEPQSSVQCILQNFRLIAEQKVFCENCQSQQVVEKTTSLASTPKFLVLHLHRFINHSGHIEKNLGRVEYRMLLTFTVQGVHKSYSLSGIVAHIGHSVNGGHYIAIVKNQNRWLRCSDSTVSPIAEADVFSYFGSEEKVGTGHAYLLFYEELE